MPHGCGRSGYLPVDFIVCGGVNCLCAWCCRYINPRYTLYVGGAALGEAAADGYFEEGGAGGAGTGPVGARLCVVLLPAPMLYIGVQSEHMSVALLCVLCLNAWVSGSFSTQVWPHSFLVFLCFCLQSGLAAMPTYGVAPGAATALGRWLTPSDPPVRSHAQELLQDG